MAHPFLNKSQAEKSKAFPHIVDGINQFIKDQIPQRDIQQPESHYNKAHNRTAAKGYLQAAIQALTGTLGRAGRGVRSRLHTQKTTQTAEKPAGQKSHRNEWVLNAQISTSP